MKRTRTRAIREELSARPVGSVDAKATNRLLRVSTRLVCEILEFVDTAEAAMVARTCSSLRAMCSLSLRGPPSPLMDMRTHLDRWSSRTAIQQAAILQRFRHLRRAKLSHMHKKPLELLCQQNGPTLEHLELSLHYSSGSTCHFWLPALQSCPNLHTLNVRWDSSHESVKALSECKLLNLRTLTLRDDNPLYYSASLRDILAVVPHVTHLSLAWPHPPVKRLHNLGDLCPKLETLELICLQVSNTTLYLDGSKMRHLRRLQSDTQRVAWKSRPDDANSESEACAIPPVLTSVQMDLGSLFAVLLSSQPAFPHLTHLATSDLWFPRRGLYHMPSLRALALGSLPIRHQNLWQNLSPYYPDALEDKALEIEQKQRPRELWAPQLELLTVTKHTTPITINEHLAWEQQTRHVLRVRAHAGFKFQVSNPCWSLLCPICHPP